MRHKQICTHFFFTLLLLVSIPSVLVAQSNRLVLTGGLASGGGGGVSLTRYDAGNGCWVYATGTGITFTKASGTGTINIPNGVQLISARVNGATADLDGSNNFTVVLNNVGTVTYNQGVATYIPPNIDVLNTAAQLGGGPSNALPFIYDEKSSPQVQVTATSSGDLSARVINLNAFSNWSIVIGL